MDKMNLIDITDEEYRNNRLFDNEIEKIIDIEKEEKGEKNEL